ncbi:MAG TPA: hypothetical protein P5294_08440 [Smithellaceae bacterium]|nr:hypothetical protein [Smithellaceae bacterium]HRS89349.1 hypothetical protein [Smithellaceae bacterium]HRV26554.1 hypothetical protein [Smithellaceae bacterium]
MSAVKPEFIEHNGKKIFYLNFSHMEKDAIPAFMEEAKRVLSAESPSSVLFLANVNKMSFDKQIVKNFVDFFKFTKTYTQKTAVIGLDTIKKMLYEAVLVLSGRGSENIRVFDGPNAENKAKDWLTII